MAFSKAPGILFSDLIGEGHEALSLERIEQLLDPILQDISEQAGVSPNRLVRVCHKDKVVWMTQSQASEYLNQPDSDDRLKREVQRALYGELQMIRRELEILLALAQYTLNHFKESRAINRSEISRIEQCVERRKVEMNESISELAQFEAILSEKRRRSPLLDQYEELMGRFLNEKSKGNQAVALLLAKQLTTHKKKYLLLTRAIEPDVRTVHYHRLNLQKLKKRLLAIQNEICTSRIGYLQIEIESLHSELTRVKQQIDEAEKQGRGSATDEIAKRNKHNSDQVKKQIVDKETELSSLEAETAILARHEQQVDSLIQHISENILHEVEQKFSMDQVKSTGTKIEADASKPKRDQSQKRTSGMHFNKHR